MITLHLVFNEVEFTPSSSVGIFLLPASKLYRHADGSDNAINDYNVQEEEERIRQAREQGFDAAFGYWDLDSNTKKLLIPAARVNRAEVLEKTQKLFEIFKNITVKESDTIPDSWNVSTDLYMKIKPGLLPGTQEFNDLELKYHPFKRLKWVGFNTTEDFFRGKDVPERGVEGVYSSFGFALFTEVIGNASETAYVCAHEAGHFLGLGHQGDERHSVEVKQKDLSYYGSSYTNQESWSPIMGYFYGRLAQWSNSDYFPSSRNQNDVYMMSRRSFSSLHKTPPKGYVWQTGRRGKPSGPPSKIGNTKKIRKLLRYLKEEDGTVIEGMLGYPFDFDLYAIVVKPGVFYASVTSNSNLPTPCSLEIISCECQLDLKKYGIIKNIYDFETPWVADPSVYDAYSRDMIFMDNAKKFVVTEGSQEYPNSSILESINDTTLIFLKVAGGWKEPVNGDRQPTTDDMGISQYGALGKYKLQISAPSSIPSFGFIPFSKCEKFIICNNRRNIVLWTTERMGFGGSNTGLHVLKQPTLINGEIEEKKFLVYGEPININDPLPRLPSGRPAPGFYLKVIIDGQCKKQEFVVGY